MNDRHHRYIALLTAIVILVITLFSMLFVIEQAGHDCTGHDCPICEHVREARQAVQRVGSGIIQEAIAFLFPLLLLITLGVAVSVVIISNTLIEEKIRMNN